MQNRVYKIHFFNIFSQKKLHMSKKSSTFASNLKFNTITIRFYSQI